MKAAQATGTITSIIMARPRQEDESAASGRRGRNGIHIAALQHLDANAVMAMLGRCSASTLYHRFHGVTDGVSHATQVLHGSANGDAFAAWSADDCIGLASLAFSGDKSMDIGVLVEDSWQRRGVGSALVAALVGRARERRVPVLVADVLADDQFIVPLLARIGPFTTSVAYGGYTVRVSLERRRVAGSRREARC